MQIQTATSAALQRAGVTAHSKLGLGVSGGADSTAMLHVLVDVRAPADIHVLHVDHMLRADSSTDAQFVARMCEELGLSYTILRADPADATVRGEAAARDIRYKLFESAAQRLGLDFVATAHTLDDQAETVLARLLRGAGARGLSAMAPRRGIYVRPMLDLRRDDLREWLTQRGITWLQDSTNLDTSIERNWLRHVVIPQLAERRGSVVVALARHAELAASDEDFIAAFVDEAITSIRPAPQGWLVPIAFLGGHQAVLRRVVRGALEMAGARCDYATIWRVTNLIEAPPPAGVEAGNGVWAWRVRGGLALVAGSQRLPRGTVLALDSQTEAEEFNVTVRVSDGLQDAWAWRCRLDHVRHGLQLRTRRAGDRVSTSAGSRTVADVLTDAKVPRFLRDRVPVLCDGDEPVAVIGLSVPKPSGHITVDARPSGLKWGEHWWTTGNLPTS